MKNAGYKIGKALLHFLPLWVALGLFIFVDFKFLAFLITAVIGAVLSLLFWFQDKNSTKDFNESQFTVRLPLFLFYWGWICRIHRLLVYKVFAFRSAL